MNKKNFLYIFIGVLIGIGLTLGTAYYAIDDYVIDDYGNEAKALSGFLEKSKDPVFQKDYVLAGLTLSSDFQAYLVYGVENGWWTEEFLTQVLIDDVLPVYIDQYSGTIDMIKSTESFQEIMNNLDDIKEFINNLPIDKIVAIVNKLLSLSLPDLEAIKNKIGMLGEIRTQVADALNNLRGVIAGLMDQLNALEEQLPEFKDKIEQVKTILENLGTAVDNIEQWIPKFYQHIQDILDQLAIIQQQLEDILEIIGNVTDHIPEIQQLINKIQQIILTLQSLLSDVDADFNFVEGANTILGQTFTLTAFQALILNAIDITIVIDTYDNGGTPLNFSDDTLIIGQIYVAFESSENMGIDIVLGNITLTGSIAKIINGNVDTINNLI